MGRSTGASSITSRGLTLAGLIALLLFVSCGGGIKGLKGEDQVFLEPGFWERAEAMFEDEGGGYWLRQKETQIRYEGGNWYVKESYHTQIVVLDADRLEEYADVSIPFGPSSRLVSVKARTITSSGEVIPVAAERMHDKSRMPDFTLYSDRKARVFPMPEFRDRCVLDVSFEREDQNVYFMDEYAFGSRLPVRRATYSYSLDARAYIAGLRVYYKSYNTDSKPVESTYQTHFGELVQLTWEIERIDAYPEERWMPPRALFLPRVALAGFRASRAPDDWSDFGSWYAKVLPRFDEIGEDLDHYVEEMVGRERDEAEGIQALIDYFGDNIRYVSIDIGESGWEPHRPVEVMENKYGDCKDMTCLAVAILRRMGVKAYPALVRTRDNAPVDPELVVPLFNHMIVYVDSDGEDVWLDPTAAPFPLGYLPPMVRDTDALVIRGKEAVWKHIPAVTPFGSMRTTTTSLTVTPTGMLTGDFRTVYTGDMGVERKWSYAGKGSRELMEALEEDAVSCFREVSLDTCAVAGMDRPDPAVTISGKFRKPSAAIRLEDRMVLRLDFIKPMVAVMAELPRASERRFPLWVPFAFEEIDTLRIGVPAGWEVAALPMEVSSADRYGSYRFSCSREGRYIVAVVHNELEAGEYQGNRYKDFIDFWTRARESVSQDVVLSKM